MFARIRATYRDAFSGLPGPVWALAGATLVHRSGTMVIPFLALYLTGPRGFSTTDAGLALSLFGLGAIGGAYIGGRLSDRIGPVRTQGLSLVLAGIGFVVLGAVRSRIALAASLLTVSLVAEAFRPANAAALATFSPPKDRARAAALRRLASNVGMTLGPAVGGFLARVDYGLLFLVDGVTCFLAAVVLWATFGRARPGVGDTQGTEVEADRSPWRDRSFLGLVLLLTVLMVVFFQVFSTFPRMGRMA